MHPFTYKLTIQAKHHHPQVSEPQTYESSTWAGILEKLKKHIKGCTDVDTAPVYGDFYRVYRDRSHSVGVQIEKIPRHTAVPEKARTRT